MANFSYLIGGSIFISPLTTKGDVFGFSTGNARVAVGSNGTVLTADSTAATGVSWQANGGGDVAGPGSSTNDALVKFSGTTGKLIAQITPAANSVLVTNGSSSPSLSTDLPTAVTIGTAYIYRVGGTDVAVADGGTGLSSWTQNGLVYASGATTLAQVTPGASSVLVTNGSNVPSLSTNLPTAVTIGGAYIYRASGTDVPVADGGTGVSSLTAYAVICGGTTSTNPVQSLSGVGNSGEVLTSNGPGQLPSFQAVSGGITGTVATMQIVYGTGSSTVDSDGDLQWDGSKLGIGLGGGGINNGKVEINNSGGSIPGLYVVGGGGDASSASITVASTTNGTNPKVRIFDDTAGGVGVCSVDFLNTGGSVFGQVAYDQGSGSMTFVTNASTHMTLDNAGNLTPTGNLDISNVSNTAISMVLKATVTPPSTSWTAGVPNQDPNGFIKITSNGGTKYIPFWN